MSHPIRSKHGTIMAESEPVVARQAGVTPSWVVACLELGCEYAHDVHARTSEEAVEFIARQHAKDHRLVARAQDLTTHPLYRGVE